jgi:4-amino-4-deoxy-L-arabinose transferase-like glycosyltransferase|tara:strand:+ start:1779 stop:3188 length:1410 start_codon:yes stop_codon:yes gene_type:complete
LDIDDILTESFYNKFTSLIDVKIVILILFALHLFVISFPLKGLVFDEAFYVPAARDILNGVGSNPEHPFLGKAWIALGIYIFGDNWFGWRIVPSIFSVLSLSVFYLISKRFLGKNLAVYATAMLGFEVMFFVHGSLALLEVPSIFFAFLSFWLYLERKGKKILKIPLYYWLSTLAMGLAFLSKETAAFYVIIIIFLYIVTRVQFTHYKELLPKFYKAIILLLVLAGVYIIPVTIYDVVYQPSSSTEVVITHSVVQIPNEVGIMVDNSTVTNTETNQIPINNALEHLIYTVSYASGLTITNDSDVNSGNYAWNWVLPIPSYPPSPYYVESAEVRHTTRASDEIVNVSTETLHPISWYGIGTNIPIWWSIWLIVPFTAYNILRKEGKEIDYFLLIWILGTYLPMIYTSGVVGRIVYPFYFIQTVPALALGIPYMVSSIIKAGSIRNLILVALMLVVLVVFVLYFPVRVNDF